MKRALIAVTAALAVPLVGLPVYAHADQSRQCEIERRLNMSPSYGCAMLQSWGAWAGSGSAPSTPAPPAPTEDATVEALHRLLAYVQSRNVVLVGEINEHVRVYVTKTDCQADEGSIAFVVTKADHIVARSGCAIYRGDTIQVTVGDNVHVYSAKNFKKVVK